MFFGNLSSTSCTIESCNIHISIILPPESLRTMYSPLWLVKSPPFAATLFRNLAHPDNNKTDSNPTIITLLFTNFSFCICLQLLQNHSRNFSRVKPLISHFNIHSAIRRFSNFIGQKFLIPLNLRVRKLSSN